MRKRERRSSEQCEERSHRDVSVGVRGLSRDDISSQDKG
jgi:hypothetical protein